MNDEGGSRPSQRKDKNQGGTVTNDLKQGGGGGIATAKQLNEMPDYSNQATRSTEKKLGAFIYDMVETPSMKGLI
jgi:hypothetical protein